MAFVIVTTSSNRGYGAVVGCVFETLSRNGLWGFESPQPFQRYHEYY